MADRTIATGGGNYNATGSYDEAAIPTSADRVLARSGGDSGALTITAAAAARSADFTNYAAVLTHNSGVDWTIGDATAGAGNVALKLVAGMTYTLGNATSSRILMGSSSATQQTITTAGKTVGNFTVNGVGCNYILTDSLTSTGTVTLNRGTFNSANQAITASSVNGAGSNTRTITLGSSTVTCNGPNGWNCSSTTNLTLTPNTATIILSGASTPFSGGGLTYGGTVNFSGTGTCAVTGANSIATFTVTGGVSRTVTFPASVTNTITSLLRLRGGGVLTVASSSAGSAATISAGGGVTVDIERCIIKDIIASGGATFVAVNCRDDGGNSGITFERRQRGWGMELAA